MCKTLSILNMNCFSGESCAVMREIKLKGKYLEYLYILIEEDWLKRVTECFSQNERCINLRNKSVQFIRMHQSSKYSSVIKI